jgi:hypothetical protein
MSHSSIPVVDPLNAVADPTMPFLSLALDPATAEARILCCIAPSGNPRAARIRYGTLARIEVRRYKPGRRCLIEYRFLNDEGEFSILGKVRAKGTDRRTFEVVNALWNAGFDQTSSDGVSVPMPLGLIPEFQMWLQLRAPGEPAASLISGPGGDVLARRIAEALHKLHRTVVPTDRVHSTADELQILRDRLSTVSAAKPEWRARLQGLLRDCERLVERFPQLGETGIHRDFYADHALVNGNRLWLLDFDLYCRGHAALDAGNFIGHLTEHSLRVGDPVALEHREQAFEDRFVELAGEDQRWAVKAYAALTLARHVYISTLFPARQAFTEQLLELAETRVRRVIEP